MQQWYGATPSATGSSTPPPAGQFNLNLSNPTQYESFEFHVGPDNLLAANAPDILALLPSQQQQAASANLTDFFGVSSPTRSSSVLMTGPTGAGSADFVPANTPLPYTVNFQNPPANNETISQIRIGVQLDPNLDVRTFQLGEIQLGNLVVNIPAGRGSFTGTFDFTSTAGFLLNVVAGVDVSTGQAIWQLTAIDPTTGLPITDPSLNLLPPNTDGTELAFVTYTVEASSSATTGIKIGASAVVTFNNDTPLLTNTRARTRWMPRAPATTTTVTEPRWATARTRCRGPCRTIPAALASRTAPSMSRSTAALHGVPVEHDRRHRLIYTGPAGRHGPVHRAQRRQRGQRRERASAGRVRAALQSADQPRRPAPRAAHADAAAAGAAAHAVHVEQQPALRAGGSQESPPRRQRRSSLRLSARCSSRSIISAFATGFADSGAGISPLGIAFSPDGQTIYLSGGAGRDSLYRFSLAGGQATTPLATLDVPLYDMGFDSSGSLWATTGGGPLVQLDPTTGQIINRYGNGITLGMAIDPNSTKIYVASASGVEIFDTKTHQFTPFSATRVDGLALNPADGSLWGVTWPNNGQVVQFDKHGNASVMLVHDRRGRPGVRPSTGTALAGLLFLSHDEGGNLTMVDLATMQSVDVATGGSRGDFIHMDANGRLYITQSTEVDVFSPVLPPHVVASTPVSRSW